MADLRVSVAGSVVSIAAEGREAERIVARLRHTLTCDNDRPPIATFELHRRGDNWQIRVDGELLDECGHGHLVDRIENRLVDILVAARPDLLWLHAGAARRQDGLAIVLPGPPGSGKSTLAISLFELGWSYLSDESVPVVAKTATALPFPRTPRVRVPSAKAANEFRLANLRKRAYEVPAERVCREPVELKAIVFPQFLADTVARLRPRSPASAVLELLQHCHGASERSELRVAGAVALVERLPVFDLHYSDGAAAAARLDELPLDGFA